MPGEVAHVYVTVWGESVQGGQWGNDVQMNSWQVAETYGEFEHRMKHARQYVEEQGARVDRRKVRLRVSRTENPWDLGLAYGPKFPLDQIWEALVADMEMSVPEMHEDEMDTPVFDEPKWCVMTGDPVDGFDLLGPFDSEEAALRLAEQRTCTDWWIREMSRP